MCSIAAPRREGALVAAATHHVGGPGHPRTAARTKSSGRRLLGPRVRHAQVAARGCTRHRASLARVGRGHPTGQKAGCGGPAVADAGTNSAPASPGPGPPGRLGPKGGFGPSASGWGQGVAPGIRARLLYCLVVTRASERALRPPACQGDRAQNAHRSPCGRAGRLDTGLFSFGFAQPRRVRSKWRRGPSQQAAVCPFDSRCFRRAPEVFGGSRLRARGMCHRTTRQARLIANGGPGLAQKAARKRRRAKSGLDLSCWQDCAPRGQPAAERGLPPEQPGVPRSGGSRGPLARARSCAGSRGPKKLRLSNP